MARQRPQAILVYDDTCTYCRGFAALLGRLDRDGRVASLPFDGPDAQELLRAQFGEEIGFAMYLVEEEHVSWGARAAERVIRALKGSRLLARLAFALYPWLLRGVSRLSGRDRSVCGPACAASATGESDASGSAPLTSAARDVRDRLLGERSRNQPGRKAPSTRPSR